MPRFLRLQTGSCLQQAPGTARYFTKGGGSMLTPLVLVLLVPSAEPNEAEKLFRQMETKVMQAKTLECTYEGKVDYKEAEDDQKDTLKGKLLLGEGNKLRIDFSGMGEKGTIISDGTKWRLIGDKNKETPK